MKKLLTILMLISLNAFAQPWLKFYEPWFSNVPGSINCDYDSGYLLSIIAYNYPPHDQHQLIQKLTDNGTQEYQIILGIGLNQNSRFDLFTRNSNNDYILPGGIWGQNISAEPILLKLDSCKNKVWCTQLANNPNNEDFFWDAVSLPSGEIVTLSIQNDPQNSQAFHIHKFNSNGVQLWRKELASAQLHPDIWDPEAWKLLLLPDGGFLVTGYCYWPNPGPTQMKYIRSFLVKADSAGNEQWLYVHGINDYIYSYSTVSTLHNNRIYTDGAANSDNLPYSTPHLFKHNLTGNLLFDTRIYIEDTNNRTAKFNSLISHNSFGNFFIDVNMYSQNSTSNERPAFIKIDTMGIVKNFYMPDTLLNLSYAGLPEIIPNNKVLYPGVKLGSDQLENVYLIRCLTDSLQIDSIPWSNFNYDSLCEEPIINHTISLDSCLIIVSNDDYKPPVGSTSLELIPYPVPAENQLIIKHSNSLQFRDITLMFYNTLGNLVEILIVNSGTDASKIDVTCWPAGMYVAVATSGGKMIGNCKLIKE
ncbi:MAG TPA: T9SS type A sorting domain-containing protein [Lentimicrobium sp.]|nr:T9SS type A sorting domain-containing protein [Lentimicrobium sp.]